MIKTVNYMCCQMSIRHRLFVKQKSRLIDFSRFSTFKFFFVNFLRFFKVHHRGLYKRVNYELISGA